MLTNREILRNRLRWSSFQVTKDPLTELVVGLHDSGDSLRDQDPRYPISYKKSKTGYTIGKLYSVSLIH
jgi:hypothetical protein